MIGGSYVESVRVGLSTRSVNNMSIDHPNLFIYDNNIVLVVMVVESYRGERKHTLVYSLHNNSHSASNSACAFCGHVSTSSNSSISLHGPNI